jgi:HK97 family phage major capsid protein
MEPKDLKPLRQRTADLKADIARLTKERADIGNTAIAEKRPLTDEERGKFVALQPQIEAAQANLAEAEQLLAAAEVANEADRKYRADKVRPDADAAAAEEAAKAAGISGKRLEIPPAAKLGVFGRQLQAVRNVAIRQATPSDMDVLKPMMPQPMVAGPTGMNTDVPSDGGFLVVPERSNTIIQRMYDTGAIMSQVFRMPIGPGANGMKLPAIDETSRADNSRYGGIVSGWLGQGNTLSAGKPKFREMDLKLRKVGAFVYATDEQLADAVALEAWINKYLPLELTFRTEDSIINGDGSNKPAGILNSGAAVTVTRNTASRVLYEDVSGMWKRMWAPLRSTAVWLVDQSVEQELEQISIAIGTAGVLAPIYKPAGVSVGPNGTQGYSPATLYGRPILTTEYGATLGTVGDIILANLGEYTVIDKGAVDQAVSLHVAFLTDEAVYRFMYRVDGQLTWNAALTPKSGGSTLSPVVTLT